MGNVWIIDEDLHFQEPFEILLNMFIPGRLRSYEHNYSEFYWTSVAWTAFFSVLGLLFNGFAPNLIEIILFLLASIVYVSIIFSFFRFYNKLIKKEGLLGFAKLILLVFLMILILSII